VAVKLKEQIKLHCQQLIEDKINNLNKELAYLARDLAEDTKSSAGDKFETSREMANLERQKLADQLSQNKKSLGYLMHLKAANKHEVQTGSLIDTGEKYIFIAISLGVVEVAGSTVLVISPNAPLAQALLGVKVGEAIRFNQQEFKILQIS
jgi:transcription elongation GreA/GreB family factor